MRSKEDSHDYRYFPEPDLPPLRVDAAWLAAIGATLPELPGARRARLEHEVGLSAYDAAVIVDDPGKSFAFDAIARADPSLPPKEIANFVTGQYARALKEAPVQSGMVGHSSADDLAALLRAIVDGQVSRTAGRELIEGHLWSRKSAAELLANAVAPSVVDDIALRSIVDRILSENPNAISDYRAGKPVTGFFVGQVMKATAGAADAARVTELLRERLDAQDAG